MEFTAALCADCNSLFDLQRNKSALLDSKGVTQITFSPRSTQTLQRTADWCRLCKIFHSAILRFNERSPDGPALSILPFLHQRGDPQRGVRLSALEFHIFLDDSPPLEYGGGQVVDLHHVHDAASNSNLSTELNSLSVVWPWLKNCMATCLNSHKKCHQDHDQHFLPTRLIYIGTTRDSQLRIVNTVDVLQTGQLDTQYVALSHKWGKAEFLTLNSSNIDQLARQIRVDELPQTFKDAISASRILNVQYIWIDSLCIIQDSITDWQSEASKMDKVYRNSLCNIAASESDGPGYGLFRQRDPSLWTPFRVTFRAGLIEADYLCFHDPWDAVRDESQLSKRGWVAQERLLSPRTIHFASPVFWECRELLACQSYPRGYPLHNPRVLHKLWPSLSSSMTVKDALNMWEHFVESYTACSLSEPQDKLIAFSGIARMMQDILKGSYVAGLWRDYLVRGLLWHLQKAPGGITKPYKPVAKYRAPSWSWASVDGPIDLYIPKYIKKPLITDLHSEVTPLTEDVFGQLSGGFIEARGRLFAAGPLDELWQELYNSASIDSRHLGLDNDKICEETYFLPIAKLSTVPGYGKSLIHCILVGPAGGQGAVKHYERLGFALLNEDGDIAESEVLCPGWSAPPWPYEELERFRLI